MKAMRKLDELHGGNNTRIGQAIGVDREKVPGWRDGTSRDLKVIESFAKLMDQAGMSVAPLGDARAAILEVFGPWMAKVESDLEELKTQRVKVVIGEAEPVHTPTRRNSSKADALPGLVGKGMEEKSKPPVRAAAERVTRRKWDSA